MKMKMGAKKEEVPFDFDLMKALGFNNWAGFMSNLSTKVRGGRR